MRGSSRQSVHGPPGETKLGFQGWGCRAGGRVRGGGSQEAVCASGSPLGADLQGPPGPRREEPVKSSVAAATAPRTLGPTHPANPEFGGRVGEGAPCAPGAGPELGRPLRRLGGGAESRERAELALLTAVRALGG